MHPMHQFDTLSKAQQSTSRKMRPGYVKAAATDVSIRKIFRTTIEVKKDRAKTFGPSDADRRK
jgi:hypothetical protein